MIWLDVPVLGSWAIVYVSLRPTGQQRFLQVLVGVGPVFSFFAACDVEALGRLEDNDEWWHIMTVSCRSFAGTFGLFTEKRPTWRNSWHHWFACPAFARFISVLNLHLAVRCRPISPMASLWASWPYSSESKNRRSWCKMEQIYANTLYNNFNLMFIDSFDQTSSSQMWWSGERCHASASFQECALPGRVWMGLSKRTAVNRWMNVLSCVIDLRGKKI